MSAWSGWQEEGRVDGDMVVGGKPAEQPIAPSIFWDKSTPANAKKKKAASWKASDI